MKGTYLLLLRLDTEINGLLIGRLGRFDFATGYYLYVGSAYGSGGLAARLAYHLQPVKAHPHWHVDYLRPYAQIVETWSVCCEQRLECRWVQALAQVPQLCFPVRKFGASDSRCYSHMLYAPQRPGHRLLTNALLSTLETESEQCSLTLDISVYEDQKRDTIPV